MRLYAISDLHLSYAANRQALEDLPAFPEDWLALAGDVGETEAHLDFALAILTQRFAQVLWAPGNHELWTLPGEAKRGEAKYQAMLAVCRRHGVLTPEDPYAAWPMEDGSHCLIAPLFTLYDYSFRPAHVAEIVAALILARDLGARSVSLTGLLPSATDYGNAIIRAIPEGSTLPRITTGHAMTAASVVLNIGKIVTEAGRTLPQERVAFLGLGSIGLTSLRLLLQSSPHPQSLVLCDLFHKSESLQAIRDEILGDMGFQGDIKLIAVHDELPPAVYEASLFVGATNVPDVLDVQQLRPGSLIVDDSGPHCFNLRQAKERIARQADILFTEGGAVRLPAPVRELWHVPLGLETVFAADWATEPNLIMGCVLSSLLSAKMSTLSHTVGAVEPDIGLNFYRKLEQLGIQAAPLHGENYVLPSDLISTFRARTSVEG